VIKEDLKMTFFKPIPDSQTYLCNCQTTFVGGFPWITAKFGQNLGSAVRDVYVKVLLDDNRQMLGTLAHHGHLVLSRAVNEGQ